MRAILKSIFVFDYRICSNIGRPLLVADLQLRPHEILKMFNIVRPLIEAE